jgi:exodeoxyribonuclease V gamma subunit
MALLDLKDSRFGISQILALLDSPVISQRFDLSDRALEKIDSWIDALNVCWGRDAAQLAALGLPQHSENTWRSAIERLLLGVALTGDRQQLFEQIRPYGNIAGSDLQRLGNFLEFLDRVFLWADRLAQKRSPAQWRQELLELMAAFFLVAEDHEWDFQLLKSALDELGHMEAIADFHLPVGLDVVRAHIEKRLNQPRYGYGFMTGGVTFCAMLPMRSIPFKVVCMIGMDNAAFPRDPNPLGFDLMRRYPRPGDRSQRNDDRYLFLEALLSARHKLYISYVGQSIQDNMPIPPSVLVSELIDYLTQRFGLDEADIVVAHPLQGFSQRYFVREDPRLFSYSRENYAALVESTAQRSPSNFLDAPVPPRADEGHSVDLQQLCRFYVHPTRYFLHQRMGLRLEERRPARADKEMFNLEGLERHRIGQELIDLHRRGAAADAWLPVFKAEGRLPQGRVGEVLYRELEKNAAGFIERLQPLVFGQAPANIEIDLDVGSARLLGRLEDLYPQGLLRARFARERAKDLLRTWIRHLILCAMTQKGRAPACPVTFLVSLNAIRRFDRVEKPLDRLAVLVKAYQEGLQAPLPLFPESSLAYVTHLQSRGKTVAQSLQVARKYWLGDDFRKGESQDPNYELVFGRTDPIDNRFATLARAVFEPLLEHMQKIDALN